MPILRRRSGRHDAWVKSADEVLLHRLRLILTRKELAIVPSLGLLLALLRVYIRTSVFAVPGVSAWDGPSVQLDERANQHRPYCALK
jgi:hypothetical protein